MPYPRSILHSFRLTKPLVLGTLAVVLAVSGLPVPSFISGIAHSLATPFWSVREALRTHMETRSQESKDTTYLTQELDALRNEVATLRRENFASRVTSRDDSVQNSENISRLTEEGVVSVAQLDMRSNMLDILILDVGTSDGVRDRMLVTSLEGIAVGFIERAHSNFSQARLFSSADVSTNAILYGTTTFPVVLSGHGAGTMIMRIPKDIPLATGAMVGLPTVHNSAIGEVVGIEFTPEDAFQTAYVRSPINQYELRSVHIDAMTTWEVPLQAEEVEGSGKPEDAEVTETE